MVLPAIAPLFREPIFPLLLISSATALGDELLRRLPGVKGSATRLERGLLAAAIGLGILSLMVFALAASGSMRPSSVTGLAAFVFLATLPGQWRCGRAVLRTVRAPSTKELVRGCIPCLAVLLPVLALAFLGAMAPPTDPDGLYYQLTAPRRWLSSGRLDYLPTLPQTNLPAGVNLLFALAMAAWGDVAAKTTHFALGCLALAGLFALGRRWIDVRAGALLCALWLLGGASIFALRVPDLFTFAYVDLGVAMECVAALLAWVLWRRTAASGWLVASALCAGFAASFKFTAVLYGGGLAACTAWVLFRARTGTGIALRNGGGYLFVSLMPLVPWLARTWIETGNPLYLMLAGVFPTRDWPADAANVFSEFFRTWVWGMGMTASWGESTRKAVRLGAMAAVGCATVVHTARARDEETRGFGALGGLLVLGSLAGTGLYLRYVIFALPILWLLVLRRAAPVLRDRATVRTATLVFLAINALIALRPLSVHLRDRLAYAAGRLPRDEYLAKCLRSTPLWKHVNATLPADRPILLAAGRDSYYLNAPCLVTEAYYQFAVRMDTWENFRSDLRRWGVRHVIANSTKTQKSYPGPAWAHADNETSFVRRLIEEEATELARFGDDAVYAIKPDFLEGRAKP